MPNAIQLHETLPNFYMEQPVFKGEDTAEVFETAPVVAEGSFHSQHEPHLPIEPDVVQAYWGADGMMTIQCKCQNLSENSAGSPWPAASPRRTSACMLNPVGGSFGYSIASNTFALVVTAVQNLDMPVHPDPELRRVQPHHRQAIGHLHQRPHRLRQGRQDHRRRVRRRPRPRRLRGASPSSTTLSRSASTATTSPTSRRWPAAVPRTTPSTPPTAASALPRSTPPPKRSSTWRPRRPASIPGSSATRTRPDPVTSPSTAVPTTTTSIRPCSRRPSRSTTSTRLRPRPAKAEGRHVGVGMSMGGFIITIGMFDSRRGGARAERRRHHHPLQHLGRHGTGRRHRHAHPHREGARAAGHQARPGASSS